jgi:uroporphyrinogen-III synthase
MRFSHVFVTRPRHEAEELAGMLAPLGATAVVQPAYEFEGLEAALEQPDLMAELAAPDAGRLLIFTSTRAVEYGLSQLPHGLIGRSRIAAIGPATSQALQAAGVPVNVVPESGFTSEALLALLRDGADRLAPAGRSAVILAAPGGRRKIEESLAAMGWSVQMLMVYRRVHAALDNRELQKLATARAVLSIFTSASTMQALSQRLPPAIWFRICQGEWLVISERLVRLARAYGPAAVHLSSGPGNFELYKAVKILV